MSTPAAIRVREPGAVSAPVPVLHVESDPRDARLITSLLAMEGLACVVTRVGSEPAYRDALERGGFDLILAERVQPDGDLLSVLALARQLRPEVPFICVTGSLGEDLAIETLGCGATDYVLKDRLSRLGPVVRRALGDCEERRRRRAAEEAAAALEQQLRHAQRLESVGRLAGGIAHDFNNVLTVITGHCERLSSAVDERSPARADVDLIRESCQRAAGLTRQLLAFGRHQAPVLRPAGLNDVVQNMGRVLERVLGERTTVVTSLDPAVGAVQADPGQIEQILMNLAINARDAMPDGGTITIATAAGPDGREPPVGLPPGHYARLTVTDTGHGMDEVTAARAFEPFFTTKAPGEGTGLGLSTVAGIVADAGGQVAVESRPGAGTTMRIVLPCADLVPAPQEAVADATVSPAGGQETLLLVEDEPFVRDLVRDYLRTAGYGVLEAGSAEEALALAAGDGPPIALLITDVVLPGMNGTALADELRRRMPGMGTLYMSGYPGDSMFGGETFEPGAAFLPKPFTRHVLTRTVRDVLSGQSHASVSGVGA
jgi:signal transduction histidine kinase